MNERVPAHYRAFRLGLVGLALLLLGAAAWQLTRPGVLEELLELVRGLGGLLGG